MKHERMKLLTFRTKKWMEESNEVLKWRLTTSKNGGHEQEAESFKWLGLGRKKGVYSSGHVVPVCGSNPDYRWTSIPGWSHQPGLKL